MTIQGETTLKSFFETGDRPNAGQFGDLIDSFVKLPQDGSTGILVIESTASSTTQPTGTVGLSIIGAEVTASAYSQLGITSAGILLVESSTTSQMLGILGAGAVGETVFNSITTASAQSVMGLRTMATRENVSAGDMVTTGVSAGTYPNPADLVVNAQGLITSVSAGGAGSAAGLVFLAAATAANSGSIDFTSGIDATYNRYVLDAVDLIPATDGASAFIRSGTPSGFNSGTSDYAWCVSGELSDSSILNSADAADSEMQLQGVTGGSNTGSAAGESTSFVLEFYSPAGTVVDKHFDWKLSGSGSSGDLVHIVGAGWRDSTAAVTRVQIIMSAGNITSGVARLYGVSLS